ncbi:MAG: FHA domain-containing protein [Planctomycetia bacterium]|nr:FHA domain-containing protein [Planctomycetia bacterium]
MHRHDPPRGPDHQTATTLLESFDSWAQLLGQSHPPAPPAAPAPPPPAPAAVPEAESYRPVVRRPLALLHVVDDGREDGETVRLRADRLVVGRTDGDVLIHHDISMSPRHAMLERSAEAGWTLSDLGSTGGTFVRVLAARLHDGSCIQLGASRFRLDAPPGQEACLVELRSEGEAARHPCRVPLTTIGRGGCDVAVVDRFVSPLHAELRHTASGWRIENRGLNGLWVRIEAPVRLAAPSQFQCGEQRFVFVPLGQ